MMPQAPRDPKRLALLVGLLILAVVLFRSVFATSRTFAASIAPM